MADVETITGVGAVAGVDATFNGWTPLSLSRDDDVPGAFVSRFDIPAEYAPLESGAVPWGYKMRGVVLTDGTAVPWPK